MFSCLVPMSRVSLADVPFSLLFCCAAGNRRTLSAGNERGEIMRKQQRFFLFIFIMIISCVCVLFAFFSLFFNSTTRIARRYQEAGLTVSGTLGPSCSVMQLASRTPHVPSQSRVSSSTFATYFRTCDALDVAYVCFSWV